MKNSEQTSWRPHPSARVLWFSGFFTTGMAVFVFFVIVQKFTPAILEAKRTSDWVECPAIVQEYSIQPNGSRFDIKLRYDYKWNGQKLSGTRLDLLQLPLAKGELPALAPGMSTTCFVNSEQPTESIVDRQLSSVFLVMGPIFLLFGLFFSLIAFKLIRMAMRRRSHLKSSRLTLKFLTH